MKIHPHEVFTICSEFLKAGKCAVFKASMEKDLFWEDGDDIITLRRYHSFTCMLLTINLVLDEKVSFLSQICSAVSTDVALRVPELVTQFDKHAPMFKNKKGIKSDNLTFKLHAFSDKILH